MIGPEVTIVDIGQGERINDVTGKLRPNCNVVDGVQGIGGIAGRPRTGSSLGKSWKMNGRNEIIITKEIAGAARTMAADEPGTSSLRPL